MAKPPVHHFRSPYLLNRFAGAALAIASLFVAVSPASAQGLSLSPASGPIGTTVMATGSGFHAGETVKITFNGQLGPTVATPTANASGSIQATFTIPSTGYSADPVKVQSYTIWACGQFCGSSYATASFSVTSITPVPSPTVVTNPTSAGTPVPPAAPTQAATAALGLLLSVTSGSIGTSVTATGTGFQPGEQVKITFNGQLGPTVATPTANASGSFQATFTIPSSGYSGDPVTAKDYFIWACGQFCGSSYATATFTVTGGAPAANPTSLTGATPNRPGSPAAQPTSARPLLTTARTGTVIIANDTAGDVTEVDVQGNIVWQLTGLNHPTDAERLSSGTTLIAESRANRVIEVAQDGTVSWQFDVEGPFRAHRLANGNTLITAAPDAANSRVLEIAPDFTEVWFYRTSSFCVATEVLTFTEAFLVNAQCQGAATDAVRLSNGDTAIAFGDSALGVAEVDADGNALSRRQVLRGSFGGLPVESVEELPDGYVLAIGSQVIGSRVVELGPAGDQRWYYGPDGFCEGCLYLPRYATRTTVGTTLIADEGKNRIIEIDGGGNVVWKYDRPRSGPFSVKEVVS